MICLNVELEQRFVDKRVAQQLDTYVAANPTHKSAIPELARAVEESLSLVTFYTGTRAY